MTINRIRNCFEKRRKTKSEVWDREIRQTTASRHVREHADQEITLHGINLYKCSVCNSYSDTGLIHVAHVIASSSFSDSTPLGIINHIYNLLPMCQTCHRKNDSPRHDKEWVNHRLKVIDAIKKQMNSIKYIHDEEYNCPVNLTKLLKYTEDKLFYENFVDCSPIIIPNTGKRYRIPDHKLYELRNTKMGDATIEDNVNGSPYYNQRQHAKSEAYKHGMYNNIKCLMCDSKICDLSHANRLCDILENVPLGIVNHIHNIIWLCPNHNHLLDNPPPSNIDNKYRKEYDWFIKTLQDKLIGHREKFNQIPIKGQSFLFNPISVNNWKVVEA